MFPITANRRNRPTPSRWLHTSSPFDDASLDGASVQYHLNETERILTLGKPEDLGGLNAWCVRTPCNRAPRRRRGGRHTRKAPLNLKEESRENQEDEGKPPERLGHSHDIEVWEWKCPGDSVQHCNVL